MTDEVEVSGTPIEAPAEDAKAETQEVEAAESSPADEEVQEPQKPKGVQKRLDELTRNWRDAERREASREKEAEYWRELALKGQTPAKAEAPSKLPRLEDFNYDEGQYTQALDTYLSDRAQKAAEQLFQSKTTEQQKQQRQQTFEASQAKFIAEHPDYTDKVLRNPALPITDTVADVLMDSDYGPQVAYFLADNPEVAMRLSRMNERQIAREVGRIEARLAMPAPKTPSKAPPPPPKIEAVDSTVEKDPNQMSVEEWQRWRAKDLKSKGRL